MVYEDVDVAITIFVLVQIIWIMESHILPRGLLHLVFPAFY